MFDLFIQKSNREARKVNSFIFDLCEIDNEMKFEQMTVLFQLTTVQTTSYCFQIRRMIFFTS